MATGSRKAKVTEEHRAEAARLKTLWESRPGPLKLSQVEFGERYEIGNQSAVGQFLRGELPLSRNAARGFVVGLNEAGHHVTLSDISPRLQAEVDRLALVSPPAEEEFVPVKRIGVSLSAGHGAEPATEDVVGHLQFTRDFLRDCGVSPGSARVVDVKGPSMEPTIRSGAVLLVSLNNKEPVDNAIFAMVRPVEGLIVKRLVHTSGGWVARSDNREFEDIPINHGEPIRIIGRAHWMGVKL